MKKCKPSGKEIIDFRGAAACGEMAIVKKLLAKHGEAIINKTTRDGTTVLMFAAFFGEMEMVAFLLKRGADIEACNNLGDTALAAARREKHAAVAGLLEGVLEQRREKEAARQFAEGVTEITQTIMGGLQKPIAAPKPWKPCP